MLAPQKRSARFRRDGDAPGFQLTEDDILILWHVWRHRVIDSRLVTALFPNRSQQVLLRRLNALFRAHYLDRPREQALDYKPGGGSRPMIYGLDREGARVLRDRFGASLAIEHWGQKNREIQKSNIDHALATTRFMVNLEVACRRRGDIRVLPFDELLSTYAPARTRSLPTPDRWKAPTDWNGHKEEQGTRPDRIFGLHYDRAPADKNRSYFFVEIDEGTETVVPSERRRQSASFFRQSSFLRKMLVYAFSRQHEVHKQHFGFPVPARILTVTTTPLRTEALIGAFRDHLQPNPLAVRPGLFLFTDKATLAAQSDVLATPWRNGAGKEVWIDGR